MTNKSDELYRELAGRANGWLMTSTMFSVLAALSMVEYVKIDAVFLTCISLSVIAASVGVFHTYKVCQYLEESSKPQNIKGESIVNVANMNKAISVMKRADKVHLAFWQKVDLPSEIVTTEAELKDNGIPACFAGYIAVSPEWKADGGTLGGLGYPVMGDLNGSAAIAEWLGLPFGLADALSGFSDFNEFYGPLRQDVTAEEVVAKLEQILAAG